MFWLVVGVDEGLGGRVNERVCFWFLVSVGGCYDVEVREGIFRRWSLGFRGLIWNN